MAWIRRVRTASGATAVQIAEYHGGRRMIVAHVGSARTEAELGILLERAREMLADPAQGAFDLGIEPAAPRARLVTREAAPALFDAEPPGETPAAARPARVLSTDSRLLFQALDGVYGDLGFGALDDDVFRDLVLARVVEPTSILDTGRVLADLGRKAVSEKTMRRTLARCADRGYRGRIAELCFAHALASGNVSLILYDVTTLYFEAEHEDALRKVGYSKERRVDPALFRIADLAQGILVLGLEVQRRHVVEDEGDIAAGPRVREAQFGDLVPVAAVRAAGQGPAHGLVAGRLAAQVRQDPAGVQDRGRLDDPGQDQVPEHVIAQGSEPQVAEDAVQDLEQQPRVRRHHPRRPRSRRGLARGFRVEQRRRGLPRR